MKFLWQDTKYIYTAITLKTCRHSTSIIHYIQKNPALEDSGATTKQPDHIEEQNIFTFA
jgi:hypothetical protein